VSRRRLADWGLGALLGIVCAVAIFPRVIFEGRSLLGDFLRVDPIFQAGFPEEPARPMWDSSGLLVHYPAALVAAESLRGGELPLWNPFVGTGAPLLAEVHSAPLSPMLLPFFLAPSQGTYAWSMILRLVLAVAATFVCARGLGQGRAAATIAAVTYGIGGCAMARFDLPTEGSAYAMLPLLLMACERAFRGDGIAWLALAVGVTWYVAHPELAALSIGGAALLTVARAGRISRGELGPLLRGLALGFGLAALVIVPFVVYVLGGQSYKLSGATSSLRSDFRYLAFAPDVLRFGAGALVLAFLAVWRGATPAVRAAVATVIVAGALFLLHGLAPPPFGWFVLPKYTLFLCAFTVALLAGEGFAVLERRRLLPSLLLAAVVWAGCDLATGGGLHGASDIVAGDLTTASLVVLAVLFPRLRLLVPAALAATFVLSARHGVADVEDAFPRTPALAAVTALAAPVPPRVAATGMVLFPNSATVFRVNDLRSIAAVFPVRYRAYMSLVEGAAPFDTGVLLKTGGSPLLDLAGVAHFFTPKGHFVNPRALPRVFVPEVLHAVESLADAGRPLAALRDPARTAIVEAPIGELARLQGGRAKVEIVSYRANRVEIEVLAEKDALVVLTDTFERGWVAEVDGELAPIFATDVLFRGVPVPAGPSKVVLTYAPASAHWGGVVAGLSLLLLVATFFFERGGRRNSAQ
jgi:hypothetical protein